MTQLTDRRSEILRRLAKLAMTDEEAEMYAKELSEHGRFRREITRSGY